MVLPGLVEELQKQALFRHAHELGPIVPNLFRHLALGGGGDPLFDLLVRDPLLLGPGVDRQVEVQDAPALLVQGAGLPLLGIGVLGDAPRHHVGDHLAAHVGDRLGDVGGAHDLPALLVDHLALGVHHVVVFEEVLADVEVARLDLLLRLLERPVDPRMDDRLALVQP